MKVGQKWKTHWCCGSPFPSLTSVVQVWVGAAGPGHRSLCGPITCWVSRQIERQKHPVKMPCSINSIRHTSRDLLLHCGAAPILLVVIFFWFSHSGVKLFIDKHFTLKHLQWALSCFHSEFKNAYLITNFIIDFHHNYRLIWHFQICCEWKREDLETLVFSSILAALSFFSYDVPYFQGERSSPCSPFVCKSYESRTYFLPWFPSYSVKQIYAKAVLEKECFK